MWRDEVRAFSVATRAVSWSQLLSDLHAEGHPILWYAILRLGYAITHSPLVLPIASIVIAAAAAYLILRYAPFPVWTRLLIVFGAFLSYQFSVVARSYGLGVLLMVVACIFFSGRHERPVPLSLALALLANTSVHGAIAAVILLFLWLTDLLDREHRREMLRGGGMAGVAIALAGVAIGILTARPLPEMAYASSLSSLTPSVMVKAVSADPGWALRGAYGADMAAAGQLPWKRIGLDPVTASRVIVNISILCIGWALRRHRACLAALIVAVLSFEILFRTIYPGAMHHQGILAFLLISLCWIAASDPRSRDVASSSRWAALGLLPLLATQAAALPFIARRQMIHPESASGPFARAIRESPQYRDAILMGEPDYFMEPMPYYVRNRVFMPRQNEFHYRVYFDRGAHRKLELTLSDLLSKADSLGCSSRQPVLLAIGHSEFHTRPEGEAFPAYRGTVFRWTADEKRRLRERARAWASFPPPTTDENYRIFEFTPPASEACMKVLGR